MSKIIDIQFIKGRRTEAIKQEKATNEHTMKVAQIRFVKWIKVEAGVTYKDTTIENWVEYYNKDPAIKQLFKNINDDTKIREEMATGGEPIPPKSEEISLEKKILDMINDGWSMKGEITESQYGQCLQTMVKYEIVQSDVPVKVNLDFLF